MTHRDRTPISRPLLALALLTPVLIGSLLAVGASTVALSNLDPMSGATSDAGLARIGDALALVIVTEAGADIAAARSLIVNWGILVPILALALGTLVAWWVSGRVHRGVAEARAQVVVADEERQSQLQEVVHELRTPLAVIGTNLELAGYESDGRSAKYIAAARRAVGRMARTVDDLAGHGHLAVETGNDPVDLSRVAHAIADENVGPSRARGLIVTVPGREPVSVTGVDPAALRTVVGNFMSNALRVAPSGSEITIDTGETEGWAWLAVTDQGPGLAPHLHARAFERGWQGPHQRDRQDGSGLGLTIARQLTEAQGGLVTLESEEGGGATFALWLPLNPTADRQSVVGQDQVHPAIRPWSRSTTSV